MSTGKWRAPELRNMRRIRQVWQLKVKNSPEFYAATGKRFTVVTLGKDTARAIKLAEEIRKGKPDLDREAAEYAACLSDPHLDHDGHYYAVSDAAERIAEVDEAKAIRFFKRAMGQDVALSVLADTTPT